MDFQVEHNAAALTADTNEADLLTLIPTLTANPTFSEYLKDN